MLLIFFGIFLFHTESLTGLNNLKHKINVKLDQHCYRPQEYPFIFTCLSGCAENLYMLLLLHSILVFLGSNFVLILLQATSIFIVFIFCVPFTYDNISKFLVFMDFYLCINYYYCCYTHTLFFSLFDS